MARTVVEANLFRLLDQYERRIRVLEQEQLRTLTEAQEIAIGEGVASLESPHLTGAPTSPTPVVNSADGSIATTLWFNNQKATATPLPDGTPAVGTSQRWSPEDHRHPTDPSRAAVDSPNLIGVPTAPTAPVDTNTMQLATTAFVVGQGYVKASDIGGSYQSADADLTALANLGTTGLVARTGAGTATTRSIVGNTEIAVVNGDGVAGDPTLSIGAGIARTASPVFTGDGSIAGAWTVGAENRAGTLRLMSGVGAVFTSAAITFAYNNTLQYQHRIASRHSSATPNSNALDFYLWDQTTDTSGTVGTKHAMTLTGSGRVGLGGTTAPSAALHLAAAVIASGGIQFGTDVNIYRAGSNTLKTDDFFRSSRTAIASGFGVMVDGDAVDRLLIRSDGELRWSDATNPFDTNLYRSAAHVLKTDDAFQAASYAVGTTPLAASHLSNGVVGSGAVALATDTVLAGVPTAPTAAADTNTTQLATTAFVLGQASSAAPSMAGAAAAGTSSKFSRSDHVHPVDTSRQAANAELTALAALTGTSWGRNLITLASASAARSYLGTVSLGFGDGSDGALVFDGTSTVAGIVPTAGVYRLTRDLHATTLVVDPSVTIRCDAYVFYATVSFTNNGTLTNLGANGSTFTGGGAGNVGSMVGGSAGATGTSGAGPAAATIVSTGGGAGGSGGNSGGGTLGGTPAANTVLGVQRVRSPIPIIMGGWIEASTARPIRGGQGGAAGAGDGTTSGAGGGGGGGPFAICAPIIINNGVISVNGGNGGTRGGSGQCGGGGGGGGGVIFTMSLVPVSGTGTMTAAGGTGGNGSTGGGTAGTAGAAGTVHNVVLPA